MIYQLGRGFKIHTVILRPLLGRTPFTNDSNPRREYAKNTFSGTRTPFQMPLSESLLNLSRVVLENDYSEIVECDQPINDWFIQESTNSLMDFNRRTIIGFGSISYFRSAKILSVCEVTSGQHLSVQLKYPIKGVEFKSEIPVIQTRPNSSINFVSPIKVWYNGQPFHSLPTALLYADKLKIKQQLGPKYDILTSNWPMPPNRTSGKF